MKILLMVLPLVAIIISVEPALALKKDIEFATVGSEGKVIYSHEVHTETKCLRCNQCHPNIFKMKRGSTEGITMAAMDSGRFCGECHNGGTAFDTKSSDNCPKCHIGGASSNEVPPQPNYITQNEPQQEPEPQPQSQASPPTEPMNQIPNEPVGTISSAPEGSTTQSKILPIALGIGFVWILIILTKFLNTRKYVASNGNADNKSNYEGSVMENKYQVFYQVVQPGEIVLSYKPESGAIGPIWVIGVIIAIIVSVYDHSWLDLFIAIGLIYMITRFIQHGRNEEEKAKIAEQQTKQNMHTAQNISNQLNNILQVSIGLVQELPGILKNASASLKRARTEFSDNAFSPFWDCIEESTRHLANFNNNIQQTKNNAVQYYNILKDRKHNFPSFFPEQEVFPDAAPVIEELNNVVRPGLTNFQFATIWEHRKTQNILVNGFGTLGEAITNMAQSVRSSISQLHDAISSNTAMLVDQMTMSRESFDSYSINHTRLMQDQIERLECIDNKIK